VHFVARVGLDYCKARVVGNREERKALYERLQFAISEGPDPWKHRVDGVARHEFESLHAS
jgi:nitrite reductase (NADH) large subunit